MFFFGDFEATRIEQGVLRTGRVMTDAEKNGVFTSAVRDPLTGQQFANNTIPRDRFDPVAAQIMSMLPPPNAAGGNNFIRQPNVDDESERYLARVDSADRQRQSVRAIHPQQSFPLRAGVVRRDLDGTSTSAWGRNYLDSDAVVGGWNKVIGSKLVNEARFSFARGTNDGQQDPFGEDGNAQIGFIGVPNDPRVIGGIVGIDISGHIRLGSPNFMPKFQHTKQFQWLEHH